MIKEPGVSGDGVGRYNVHVHTNLLLDTIGWHLRRYEHLNLPLHCLCHCCYPEGWLVFCLRFPVASPLVLHLGTGVISCFGIPSSGHTLLLFTLTDGHGNATTSWIGEKTRSLTFTHVMFPGMQTVFSHESHSPSEMILEICAFGEFLLHRATGVMIILDQFYLQPFC